MIHSCAKCHWFLGSFLVGIVNNVASRVSASIQNGWFFCDERWNRLNRSNFTAIYVVIVTLPAYCLFYSLIIFLSFVCCCAHFFFSFIRIYPSIHYKSWMQFSNDKNGRWFFTLLFSQLFNFIFNLILFSFANGKRRVLIVVYAHAFYTRTMNPTNNDLFDSELCYIVNSFMWINLGDTR